MIPFSDEEIYHAVKINLPKVNTYVNSHGGAIKVLGVNDGTVYIELTGTCHGCSMSLMTTKMVVERQLREMIHPQLNVINVDGSKENKLPEHYYTDHTEEEVTTKERLIDKVKKYF